jgi:hypothetical protein
MGKLMLLAWKEKKNVNLNFLNPLVHKIKIEGVIQTFVFNNKKLLSALTSGLRA